MMDNRLRKICKQIMRQKDLDEALPQFFNNITDSYYTYAGVRLAMHYVTLYETYCEQVDVLDNNAKDILKGINNIIRDFIMDKLKGQDLEKAIESVDQMRNQVINRTQIVATYTDIFQIYEYVLNRVEYRFTDREDDDMADSDFAREILQYIFDTQDNVIINGKIQEIIGQLPIRMTRQKYFELVRDSFSVYLGAEKSSLDSYLYMFRSTAMIYKIDNMEEYYPDLWNKKEFMTGLNYKELTEEAFKDAKSMISNVTKFLESETSFYFTIQEVINELYAMLLSSTYVGLGFTSMKEQQKISLLIVGDINKEFIADTRKNIVAELENNLVQLEGVQEELLHDLSMLEDVLYTIDQSNRELTKSLMIENVLNALLRIKDLLSSSLFIDFNQQDISGTVDEELLHNEKSKLVEDLTELFSTHDRAIMRAVMASTLSKMPVFFASHKEVMDYVRNSLENCTNLEEKQACKVLIRAIMNGE